MGREGEAGDLRGGKEETLTTGRERTLARSECPALRKRKRESSSRRKGGDNKIKGISPRGWRTYVEPLALL